MHNFKVGDKVLVKPNPEDNFGIFRSNIKRAVGKIHTITGKTDEGNYSISESIFNWAPYMLMPVPEPGDKVKIRTWEDMADQYGFNEDGSINTPNVYTSKFEKDLCGTTVEVLHIDSTSMCVVYKKLLSGTTYLSLSCIEEVYKKEEEEVKTFKKSDLKNGMTVTINGEVYVLNGKHFISEIGFMRLENYNEDLKIKDGNEKWNITDVCDINKEVTGCIGNILKCRGKKLFERKEVKEIPAYEVLEILKEKYGTDVKIIGDLN